MQAFPVTHTVPEDHIPADFRANTTHRGIRHARALAAARKNDVMHVATYIGERRGPITKQLCEALLGMYGLASALTPYFSESEVAVVAAIDNRDADTVLTYVLEKRGPLPKFLVRLINCSCLIEQIAEEPEREVTDPFYSLRDDKAVGNGESKGNKADNGYIDLGELLNTDSAA